MAEVVNALAPVTPIGVWFQDEMRIGRKNGLVYQSAETLCRVADRFF
jgi:hypothetical protein